MLFIKPMWPVLLAVGLLLGLLELLRLYARRYEGNGSPRATRRDRPESDIADEPCPFVRATSILSPGERTFYDTLLLAIGGEDLVVFTKVRLLDLFEALPANTPCRQSHLNRVMSKHVDFVICDRRKLRPLLVVELDDATHGRASRRARDAAVDEICDAAGLPILHCKQQWTYARSDVAREVHEAMRDTPVG